MIKKINLQGTYNFKYLQFAVALADALMSDPFYQTMLNTANGDDKKKELLIKYMDFSIAEAETYGYLYFPADHEYGLSIWSKPVDEAILSKKENEKKNFINRYLGGDALNAYIEITSFMHGKLSEIVAENAWYLSILGVKSEFQGKGLGAGLVNPVLAITDQLGISTYLETFNRKSISFYNKLGYKEIKEVLEPVTASRYWVLLRNAE